MFQLYDKVNHSFLFKEIIQKKKLNQDGNNIIEEEELDGFVKDLMDLVKKVRSFIDYRKKIILSFVQEYDNDDLQQFKRSLLNGCDLNRDKKISKPELKMILLALSQSNES